MGGFSGGGGGVIQRTMDQLPVNMQGDFSQQGGQQPQQPQQQMMGQSFGGMNPGGSSYGMSSYNQPSPMFGGGGPGPYSGAFPGYGMGGMPGRYGTPSGGGYGGFGQYGGGGLSPFGLGMGFSNFNFGPGSFSPYGAGSMGYGGGSGMYGGPMRPMTGFGPMDYNMQAQQMAGPMGYQAPTFNQYRPPPPPPKRSPIRSNTFFSGQFNDRR